MLGRTEIMDTRQFRRKFYRCLSRNPQKFRMASPYITGIPHFSPMPQFTSHLLVKECGLDIITGIPGDSKSVMSRADADIMAGQGVNLLIHGKPFLHAKIYQFLFPEGDRAAFVGSANFTAGGFEKNDEVVAFFSEKCDNDGVSRQFDRLLAASTEYYLWKARAKP